MQATRLERTMPSEYSEWVVQIVTILGSVVASLGGVYIAWRRLIRAGTQAKTDTINMELMGSAVAHWKSLHDEAWAQVRKERELREAAEQKAASAMRSIENLRNEVAELRRQVADLTALTQGKSNGNHPQV